MAHAIETIDLSPEERRFLDFMQKGDDFMKIEIYRSAKECYSKALELNHNPGLVRSKLDNCNRLLQSEKKRIIVIASVMAIIVLSLILF
jgi:hypothetical protein